MREPESDWLSLLTACVLPLAGVILLAQCPAEAAEVGYGHVSDVRRDGPGVGRGHAQWPAEAGALPGMPPQARPYADILLAVEDCDAHAKSPAETLLDCVCSTAADRPSCRERRHADIVATVEVVREVAEDEPPVAFAILLATLCGESGAKAHPRGHNDAGTSAGWYQFKRRGGHAKVFRRLHGRALDPHDLAETSSWYLERLHNSRKIARRICGKVPDLWGVAAARVAKGVWAVPPVAASCAWALDPRDGDASVPIYRCTAAVPGVPRCTPRSYGVRARAWLKAWAR